MKKKKTRGKKKKKKNKIKKRKNKIIINQKKCGGMKALVFDSFYPKLIPHIKLEF